MAGAVGPPPGLALSGALLAPLWMVVVALAMSHVLTGALGPISPHARRRVGGVRVPPVVWVVAAASWIEAALAPAAIWAMSMVYPDLNARING